MPAIKDLTKPFFKIHVDRVKQISVPVCIICNEKFTDCIGNYGNFKKHVERKHKNEYKEKFDALTAEENKNKNSIL